MSNVLNESKKQQVIALGRLGWPLRRIEQETGVRRETAGAYLRAAGIAVRPAGGWGRRASAKPANEGITDSGDSKPANEGITDVDGGFPLSPDLPPQNRTTSASTCEPHREAIELGLSRGRNAKAIWQDLVAGGYDGRLSNRAAIRRQTPRSSTARSVRHHRHCGRRRMPSRLRNRSPWFVIHRAASIDARGCS